MYNHRFDDIIALPRSLKNVPYVRWHAFECLLKSLRLVLFLDPHGGNICNFADENEMNPAREFIISKAMSRLVAS
jgi:hypothetical protein